MLRDTVREFMHQEVLPAEAKVPHDSNALLAEDQTRLRAKARELGLWCVQTPAEYGGAGLNLLGQCVVAEEAAKCRMGLYFPAGGAFGMDPPKVIFKGSKAQIEKYGLAAIKKGARTFVAISEPGGGSDPARSIVVRAELKGDRYIVNGTKMWISEIDEADWGILYARTGAADERGGITAFVVDPKRPGIKFRKIPVMRSHSPHEVHFEDYEIPIEDRLGEEGAGFAIANEWLVHARVPYGAACIGVAQASLDYATDWARQRKVFGGLLADKQAIQWMIADAEVDLRAARLLVYQAAWNADLGRDIKVDASVAKLFCSEAAFRVIDSAMQILGAMGVTHEMPLERWYREMRIRRIGEGPSEVHRMVIARDLLSRNTRMH
jgi:acyl-CoA dehydrogenase